MTLKDLIERGYFPKELPPPFDTSDLSTDLAATLASWTTVFENNTQINSGTFVLTQTPLLITYTLFRIVSAVVMNDC